MGENKKLEQKIYSHFIELIPMYSRQLIVKLEIWQLCISQITIFSNNDVSPQNSFENNPIIPNLARIYMESFYFSAHLSWTIN